MCELFDQYIRKGRREGIQQGMQAVIATYKKFGADFEETARNMKDLFRLSDDEVQSSMKRYW